MKEDKKPFITSETVVIPDLPKEDLDELKRELEIKYKVVCNYEKTRFGYVFYDVSHDRKLAKLEYDEFNKRYKSLEIFRGIKEPEPPYLMQRGQKRKTKKKRTFSLKRVVAGVALTASTVAMFTTAGIIKPKINEKLNKVRDIFHLPAVEEVVELDEDTALNEASDIVAMSWASYTMDTITKIAQSENDEYLLLEAKKIYENYYTKIISLYNDYEEVMDPNIEKNDTLVNATEILHTYLRKNLVAFNDAVRRSSFGQFGFHSSSFASAIVTDSNGKSLRLDDNKISYNEDGFPIIYSLSDNDDYCIYVKVQDIPNNNYTVNNCPQDSLMINGQIYVKSSHINDFTTIAEQNNVPKM